LKMSFLVKYKHEQVNSIPSLFSNLNLESMANHKNGGEVQENQKERR